MASWLSISLPNPFKSEEEEEEEEENEKDKFVATVADEGSEEDAVGNGGVKEDLTELTKTIGRQLWGVASFLAPPPPSSPPAPAGPAAEDPPPPSSPSSQALLGGIRSDFAEIGGSFKTGLSRLTTNKTVNEISRFASSLLQLEPDDDGEYEGSAPVVGITEEVLEFAIGASARPESWLEFPLPHDDDFVMSEVQMEHASTVENLVPTLAALRQRLCPSNMTEGSFWKIYFVMLHPLLNEQEAEFLATPQILEARGIMRQQLQNATGAELLSSGVDSLSLEVSIRYSSVQEEKSDVVDKSKIVTAATQEGAHEPETPDQWSGDDGEKGTVKQLGYEEDVSFSDLEVDNDDNEVSSRNARSKSTQDACVSSSDGSNRWVQLTQDSEARGDKSKAVRPSSQGKSSEGEDPSDWFTVDDFDFDKVETV